jgi:hypothetical protein
VWRFDREIALQDTDCSVTLWFIMSKPDVQKRTNIAIAPVKSKDFRKPDPNQASSLLP